MTDIKNFHDEVMDFLTEEDRTELETKAGVRFPIASDFGLVLEWDYLCYICSWIGIKRGLPGNLHNRMVLGEQNLWTQLYVKTRRIKDFNSDQISKIFELAG